MPVTLTMNGRTVEAPPGQSLFDCAEQAGIHVPTSCRKQGRCKECIVEVTSGMDGVSGPTEHERHLEGRFRLSCQTRIISGQGEVACHTMRRGRLRIERAAARRQALAPVRRRKRHR